MQILNERGIHTHTHACMFAVWEIRFLKFIIKFVSIKITIVT